MTGFLLDTNVPSELAHGGANSRVKEWVLSQDQDTLFLSAISIGEFRKGFTILPDGKRRANLEAWFDAYLVPLFDGRVLPVTQVIADRWGALAGRRQLAGRPLGAPDGLIAATALEHGLTLVTRNVRDFEGLGLNLFDPWA